MSRQGLYFDNMFRAYPFIDTSVGMALPDDAIVDFKCFINSEAGFLASTHKVWLYSVKRTQTHIVFSFACDAAALSDKVLSFHIPAASEEISYAFSELHPISNACVNPQSSSSEGLGLVQSSSSTSEPYATASEHVIWDGFIVVGNLTSLLESMEINDCMTDPEGYTKVEPALVVDLQGTMVRFVNIANKLPTTTTAAEGCSDGLEQSYDIITYHRNITGDIKFINGYSCNVALSTPDNSVVFTATVDDAVKGQFCGHEELTQIKYKSELIPGIKFGDDHTIPGDSLLYSGGPLCRDTLKSINGVGGKRLWILAGRGIALTEDQENYLISISATLSGLAVCYAPGTSVSVSSASLAP
jgi:hypothetical protein